MHPSERVVDVLVDALVVVMVWYNLYFYIFYCRYSVNVNTWLYGIKYLAA